jgi:hypothetical protein
MCYCLLVGHTEENYELVSKAKIELHLFQPFFTPHTPPLKQGQSETSLSPDLPSTRIIRSTIPFRKCFKLCSPMSDLVTRYGPQATRDSHALFWFHSNKKLLNQNVGKQRKKNYGKITEISASLAFLTLPVEQT